MKPTKDWTLDHGALAMARQIIVEPRDFAPDGADIEEGRANIRLAQAAPRMQRLVRRVAEAFADTDSHLGIEAVAILAELEAE